MPADRELIQLIHHELIAAADPALAPGMQAYMKSAMPYLGVRVPTVRRITRAAAAQRPPSTLDELADTVRTLWDEAGYREQRYAANALLDAPVVRRLRDPSLMPLLEHLIITGAWWDYVDETAHRVGELLRAQPSQVTGQLRRWARSEDVWLRRAAIIAQLGARQATDLELLTYAIDAAAEEKEFFLRKAIGWALREYARTDPQWVLDFVAARPNLSGLSRREALKHLAPTS